MVLVGASSLVMADAVGPDRVEGGGALYPNFESELTLGGLFRGHSMLDEDWFGYAGVLGLEGDTQLIALHAGAGCRHPLDAATDIWGGPSLEYQDLTVEECAFSVQQGGNICSSVSEDEISIGMRGGVRHRFHRQIEGEVGAWVITGDWTMWASVPLAAICGRTT